MPTIQELAQKLELSPSLVSRVLSNPTNVRASAATRKRIHETARIMGYAPNRAARALRGGRAGVIGLWTPNIEGSYFGAYFHAMRDLATANGMQLFTREVRDSNEMEIGPRDDWNWQVDGIVAFDSPISLRRHFNAHPNDCTPAVSVGPYHSTEFDHVGIDLYHPSLAAMEHLLGLGRRRIWFLGHHGTQDSGRRRAYDEATAEAGSEPRLLDAGSTGMAGGYNAVLSAYDSAPLKPDAIFALNDDIAIGALRALAVLGVGVPGEVAVIGCDGTEQARYFTPSLTTISIPAEAACQAAWEMISKRLADPGIGIQSVSLSAGIAHGESA